jgi:thiol-disulfide isomerase/thioredoxin
MAIILTIGGAILLCALTLQGWALVQLRSQNDRVQRRLDSLSQRAPVRTAPAKPIEVAPSFNLASLNGPRVSMSNLLSRGKPLLLMFTDTRCGPCYELLPDIAGWQRVYGDRLTFALISSGAVELNHAMTDEYGIENVLIQNQAEANQPGETAQAYEIVQLPAAVLVQPDGTRSGDASYGSHAVRGLVAKSLGLAMPEATPRQNKSVLIGQPVGDLKRPDLDGEVFDFANGEGKSTLVLFWSPGCHHCKDLVPDIKTWEQAATGLRTVIVSKGPAALNREAGFTSPIVLDDDKGIASLLGAQGTPAAVLLGARGLVLSSVARGATGVRSLMTQRMTTESAAAD